MRENEDLIHRFYEAFSRRDAEGMIACYADGVRFSDPVFPNLGPAEARAMWRMLTARGKDLQIVWDDVRADEKTGSAHWVATYTFTLTGRKVVNDVRAKFRIEGGKIVEHDDAFDLYRW